MSEPMSEPMSASRGTVGTVDGTAGAEAPRG